MTAPPVAHTAGEWELHVGPRYAHTLSNCTGRSCPALPPDPLRGWRIIYVASAPDLARRVEELEAALRRSVLYIELFLQKDPANGNAQDDLAEARRVLAKEQP